MRKGRNSMMKQLMALCLAVMFVLSMSMNVFAKIEVYSTGTVTVTGLESDNGAELSAYKIIDINFDTDTQQLKEPVYTWNTAVAAWVKKNYPAYINDDNTVKEAYMTLSGSELQKFYQKMSEAGILKTPEATATMENESAKLELPIGQYVISATKDGRVYPLISVNVRPVHKENGNWEIDPIEATLKGSAPGIDKTVEGDQTVAIGDTVSYVVEADIPVYPEDAVGKVFRIGDNLSAGLTLNKEDIVVKAGDLLLTRDTEYTIEFDMVNPARDFEIDFNYDELKGTAPDATKIIVEYKAVVNEKAFEKDALGNTAFIGYQRDPYDESTYTTDEVEKDVYTYGIELAKKDKEDRRSLAGAEFELRTKVDGDPMRFVETSEGVYRPAKKDETDGVSSTLVVSEAGKLEIQGIDLGTYYLKETKAPDGYVLPSTDVVITLQDKQPDGVLEDSTVTGGKDAIRDVESEGNKILFTIFNTSSTDDGFMLPTTGGAGTMLFSIVGIVLMGAAVAMVVVLNKRRKNCS